jgi:hypothetical protein
MRCTIRIADRPHRGPAATRRASSAGSRSSTRRFGGLPWPPHRAPASAPRGQLGPVRRHRHPGRPADDGHAGAVIRFAVHPACSATAVDGNVGCRRVHAARHHPLACNCGRICPERDAVSHLGRCRVESELEPDPACRCAWLEPAIQGQAAWSTRATSHDRGDVMNQLRRLQAEQPRHLLGPGGAGPLPRLPARVGLSSGGRGQAMCAAARPPARRCSNGGSGQRRSKTMRALTWPFSTSSKHSLTSSSLRVSWITRVRPCAWIA